MHKEKYADYYKLYYKRNRDKLLEKQKRYNEDNRERISQYMKEYYKAKKIDQESYDSSETRTS